jgi:hypothetical protein
MFSNLKEGTQLMSIYTPYFYIIQDVRNGIYYAGSKYGKDADPSNFMIEGGYTTTSNTVRKIIRQFGLNSFAIRKIKKFEKAEDALQYEKRFLLKVNARNNPRFYNGHNNDWKMHDNTGKVAVVDGNGMTFQTTIDDERYISGELRGVSFGTKPGIELKTNFRSNFRTDDPRWHTGELISMKQGKSHYKDNDGKSYFVDKATAKRLNLVSFSKKKVSVRDKEGNTFSTSIDDPRYISGELVGVTKNRIPVKDRLGNTHVVNVDDTRIKSGEFVQVNAEMVIAKDKQGNILRVRKDDPRYTSGKLVGVSSEMKFYNNGTSNKCFFPGDEIPEGFVPGRLKKVYS